MQVRREVRAVPLAVGKPGGPGEDTLPGTLVFVCGRGVAQGAQNCLLREVPRALAEESLSNM